MPQQAPLGHRLRRAGRNAIFSCPWLAQSRSANQAPAQLPAPSLTISTTAFAALTLRRPKSESLSWFHSYSEPSHNEPIACSSRLKLLYIPAVDRHTNHSGRLSLLLQFRAKQPSLIGTKQTTERQDQKVLLYLPLIYPKEVHNACEHWDLKRTLPDKALIEGSQSPRSDNHGRNSPQHTPKTTENSSTLHEFRKCRSPNSAMSGTQQHERWPQLHIKDRATVLQHLQLLTYCSWRLQVKVSSQLTQLRLLRCGTLKAIGAMTPAETRP